MALKLVTAPDGYPVTVEDVKSHLRIDHDDDDALIETYLAAAVSHLDGKDGILQRALKPQVWELTYDRFPCGAFSIPLPPLISVGSIKYDDAEGFEQTVDSDNYVVDDQSVPGRVVPVDGFSWPTTLQVANAVRVRFTAGYPDQEGVSEPAPSTVPAAIKHALLLIVGDWYDHRESVSAASLTEIPMPGAVKALLAPYRIYAFA